MFTRFLAVWTALCILSSPAYAATPGAGASAAAQLTEAHGSIFKRDFVDWTKELWGAPEPAKAGDSLREGMQLGTGDKSWAQVSWPNVTTRAWANTVFAIAPNQKLVYLLGGEMLFQLDKHRKDKKEYVVWTKVLQARIRGTTVLVQSDKEVSRVSVLEGCVDVMNRLDHSVIRITPGVVYEVRIPQSSPPSLNLTGQDRPPALAPPAMAPPAIAPPSQLDIPTDNNASAHEPAADDSSGSGGNNGGNNGGNDGTKPSPIKASSDRAGGNSSGTNQNGSNEAGTNTTPNQAGADKGQPAQSAPEAAPAASTPGANPATQNPPAAGTHPNSSNMTIGAGPPTNSGLQSENNAGTDTTINSESSLNSICINQRPPLAVFETRKSTTSLRVVDADGLRAHPLVTNFDQKLESGPLVEASLNKLPAVCHLIETSNANGQQASTPPNSGNQQLSDVGGLDKVLVDNAKIVRVPTSQSYKIGPLVGTDVPLPPNAINNFTPVGVIGQSNDPIQTNQPLQPNQPQPGNMTSPNAAAQNEANIPAHFGNNIQNNLQAHEDNIQNNLRTNLNNVHNNLPSYLTNGLIGPQSNSMNTDVVNPSNTMHTIDVINAINNFVPNFNPMNAPATTPINHMFNVPFIPPNANEPPPTNNMPPPTIDMPPPHMPPPGTIGP